MIRGGGPAIPEQELVGCFTGPAYLPTTKIVLSKDNFLMQGDEKYKIDFYEDNIGFSIAADHFLYFDGGNSNSLILDDRYPYLMRFSDDYNELYIPDKSARSQTFVRMAC
jgi:hypothetical protein